MGARVELIRLNLVAISWSVRFFELNGSTPSREIGETVGTARQAYANRVIIRRRILGTPVSYGRQAEMERDGMLAQRG